MKFPSPLSAFLSYLSHAIYISFFLSAIPPFITNSRRILSQPFFHFIPFPHSISYLSPFLVAQSRNSAINFYSNLTPCFRSANSIMKTQNDIFFFALHPYPLSCQICVECRHFLSDRCFPHSRLHFLLPLSNSRFIKSLLFPFVIYLPLLLTLSFSVKSYSYHLHCS